MTPPIPTDGKAETIGFPVATFGMVIFGLLFIAAIILTIRTVSKGKNSSKRHASDVSSTSHALSSTQTGRGTLKGSAKKAGKLQKGRTSRKIH